MTWFKDEVQDLDLVGKSFKGAIPDFFSKVSEEEIPVIVHGKMEDTWEEEEEELMFGLGTRILTETALPGEAQLRKLKSEAEAEMLRLETEARSLLPKR